MRDMGSKAPQSHCNSRQAARLWSRWRRSGNRSERTYSGWGIGAGVGPHLGITGFWLLRSKHAPITIGVDSKILISQFFFQSLARSEEHTSELQSPVHL